MTRKLFCRFRTDECRHFSKLPTSISPYTTHTTRPKLLLSISKNYHKKFSQFFLLPLPLLPLLPKTSKNVPPCFLSSSHAKNVSSLSSLSRSLSLSFSLLPTKNVFSLSSFSLSLSLSLCYHLPTPSVKSYSSLTSSLTVIFSVCADRMLKMSVLLTLAPSHSFSLIASTTCSMTLAFSKNVR